MAYGVSCLANCLTCISKVAAMNLHGMGYSNWNGSIRHQTFMEFSDRQMQISGANFAQS